MQRGNFGESLGINRLEGQGEEAHSESKGKGLEEHYITPAGGSQESFHVEHSSNPEVHKSQSPEERFLVPKTEI